MTNLLDWIVGLFHDQAQAQDFVNDPDRAMQNAGVQNVTTAQVQAVAAAAAPGLAVGDGDPVGGLQQALADHHGIAAEAFAPTFQPQQSFAPTDQADVASHNQTDAAAFSPDQHAGATAQQGGFNLGFGDITLGGNHTEASGHAVVTGDNAQGDILTGDRSVLGSNDTASTGDVHAAAGANVTQGAGNEVHNSSQNAGGDIISDNKGPVISKTDASGGAGGNATANHGGGLIDTSHPQGGAGGGGITIDSHDTSTVHGDETNVENHGDVGGSIDASHHDDNSTGHNIDQSTGHNVDNSTGHNVDQSTGHNVDNSQHNPNVDTHVSVPIF